MAWAAMTKADHLVSDMLIQRILEFNKIFHILQW